MSKTVTSDPASRRGYHHGALKEALVEIAERLLTEKGAGGFTMSDIARQVGVSPAAPYRHFADREALLDEVARRGFLDFAAHLRAAMAKATIAEDRFAAMGRAYLAFAAARPGAYAAMFSLAPRQRDHEQSEAGRAAFQTLVDGIAELLAGRLPGEADIPALARRVWALAHGVATLRATGRIGEDAEALLRDGAEALIAGAMRRGSGMTTGR